MTTQDLSMHLEAYLQLRQALGMQIQTDRRVLHHFVQFVAARGIAGPLRAQLAVEWAGEVSRQSQGTGAAQRLGIVRRFLTYLRVSEPETQVPDAQILATARRAAPYLFTPHQIAQLRATALDARPRGSLRPHTLATLLGLLASTGLRVGEALRLTLADVFLQQQPPHLQILATKFRKARLVPLHPTTADHLRQYAAHRLHCFPSLASGSFFVSAQGHPVNYNALRDWFTTQCRRLGLRPPPATRPPCLHSFRHTFAVRRMLLWHQEGAEVTALLPHLSIYLGHVRPEESYWYLTATPELLTAAAARFQAYAGLGGGV